MPVETKVVDLVDSALVFGCSTEGATKPVEWSVLERLSDCSVCFGSRHDWIALCRNPFDPDLVSMTIHPISSTRNTIRSEKSGDDAVLKQIVCPGLALRVKEQRMPLYVLYAFLVIFIHRFTQVFSLSIVLPPNARHHGGMERSGIPVRVHRMLDSGILPVIHIGEREVTYFSS
jgi:hypothetical protein